MILSFLGPGKSSGASCSTSPGVAPFQFGAKIWGEPCSLVFSGSVSDKETNVANLQEKSILRVFCGVHPCLYKNPVNLFTRDCGVLIIWCCSFCPPTLECF